MQLPSREDFDKFVDELFKNQTKVNSSLKVFTGTEGAITVATKVLEGLGATNITREEALSYANTHFEHNGRGSYII